MFSVSLFFVSVFLCLSMSLFVSLFPCLCLFVLDRVSYWIWSLTFQPHWLWGLLAPPAPALRRCRCSRLPALRLHLSSGSYTWAVRASCPELFPHHSDVWSRLSSRLDPDTPRKFIKHPFGGLRGCLQKRWTGKWSSIHSVSVSVTGRCGSGCGIIHFIGTQAFTLRFWLPNMSHFVLPRLTETFATMNSHKPPFPCLIMNFVIGSQTICVSCLVKVETFPSFVNWVI